MDLSREARGRLARGIGAYIHSTPSNELPGDLKRWRKFRPQSLAARADEVLPVLDDEVTRGLVGEWLDDRPKLAKRDAELLRAAIEAGEGWRETAESLAASTRSARAERPDPAEQLKQRAERERERAVAAKDELRRNREEARAALTAERQRARRLTSDLADARRELERTKVALRRTEEERERHASQRERDARRHKTTLEKARADADAVRARLRDARRESAELRQRVRELERAVARSRRAQGAPDADIEPRERSSLAPPKGLLDDAPETLEAWLRRDDVTLLVDGYNVTKSKEGYPELSLAAQRERLVDETARLARRFDVRATIVFDGSDVPPGTKRRTSRGVKVVYSRKGETADDHLVAVVQGLPPSPVVVVTSDKELQARAAELGATIAGSRQFLALVRKGSARDHP